MFSVKDFFSKCNQIHRKLQICSHLLRKAKRKTLFLYTMCKITNISKRSNFQLNLYDCVVEEKKTKILPSCKDIEIRLKFLTLFSMIKW